MVKLCCGSELSGVVKASLTLSRSYKRTCATWVGPLGTWTREDGWPEGSSQSKDPKYWKIIRREGSAKSKDRQSQSLVRAKDKLESKIGESQR